MNEVHAWQNNMAIDHGVLIIKLDPSNDSARGCHVIAVTFRGGWTIRRGHALWVQAELAKMKCTVIDLLGNFGDFDTLFDSLRG